MSSAASGFGFDNAAYEEAMAKAGLPACRAFTREEWLAHPQGKALSQVPVVEVAKVADGPKAPFGEAVPGHGPLHGIHVLDFTHVLAGPRSARSLAEYGADVLHVTSPSFPDTFAQHLGVDVGKRCTYLDWRDAEDLQKMRALARTADAFTTTYRSSVNTRFGLLPTEFGAKRARHRFHDGERLRPFRTVGRAARLRPERSGGLGLCGHGGRAWQAALFAGVLSGGSDHRLSRGGRHDGRAAAPCNGGRLLSRKTVADAQCDVGAGVGLPGYSRSAAFARKGHLSRRADDNRFRLRQSVVSQAAAKNSAICSCRRRRC